MFYFYFFVIVVGNCYFIGLCLVFFSVLLVLEKGWVLKKYCLLSGEGCFDLMMMWFLLVISFFFLWV